MCVTATQGMAWSDSNGGETESQPQLETADALQMQEFAEFRLKLENMFRTVMSSSV